MVVRYRKEAAARLSEIMIAILSPLQNRTKGEILCA
jgi:hypothetical protein